MPSSVNYKIFRNAYNQEEFDGKFDYHDEPSKSIWAKFRGLIRHDRKGALSYVKEFVPIIQWMSEYQLSYLSSDVVAGITIAILNVPQAMAYASLAGVPAVIGLYSSFLPPLLYSIFGTSKHVSLGMFAVIALMVGNVEEKHGSALNWHLNSTAFTPDNDIGDLESVKLVACLTFTIGVILAIMALCQFHIIAVYLSDPLVGGFTTAAAFHVLFSQIPKMFALKLPERSGLFKLFHVAYDFFSRIEDTNWRVLILALASLIFLYVGKTFINPWVAKKCPLPIPFELIVVVVSILISYFFDFHSRYDMPIIAHIPTGFPAPAIPDFSWFIKLLPDAIIIAIVIYVVTFSVAKLFGQKHNYNVSASQEVRALAISQLLSSFLLCHPASGSLSRSTINSQLGNKSQISSIISAVIMLIVILWVGPLLYDLPTCVLSSIIAIALRPMLIQFTQLGLLWQTSIYDFLIWVVSFVVTIAWDVSEGLICSIAFALITVVVRVQCPRAVRLAKIGDTDVYRDYHRYEGHSNCPHIVTYRFDAPLLFLNCSRFKSRGIELVAEANSELKSSVNHESALHVEFLILDTSGFTHMDSMGAAALKDLAIELKNKYNVQLLVASSKAQVRRMCQVCGIHSVIPKSLFFPTIHDAVLYATEQWTSEDEEKDKEITAV